MEAKSNNVTNVPNLRFPGFDGEWNTRSLGEITSWASGGTPAKDNSSYWNGDIPWISASSMRGISYSESELKITEAGLKKGSRLAAKGNLLILVRGSMLFNKIPIGIALRNVAFNQDVKSIVVSNESSSDFVLNWFTASESKLLNMVTGTGIGAGKLDLQELKDLKIKLPSLLEQQKISSFFSLLNQRIETQIKIINNLQSLITQQTKSLLSQAIGIKQQSGFENWNFLKIKDVLTIGSGRDYKHLSHGSVPVYGTGGLITYVNSFLFDGETVCIGRKGTIDKPFFHTGKIWTVDTLFYTHSFKNTLAKYIYYVFKTINWKEHNEASGVPSLSKSTIENIKIPIPSTKGQSFIANYLTAIDKKITIEEKILTQLKLQKKYLLANLFI